MGVISAARRASAWTGPVTSRSWTVIHPVGVCQVVPSTMVPDTYLRRWGT